MKQNTLTKGLDKLDADIGIKIILAVIAMIVAIPVLAAHVLLWCALFKLLTWCFSISFSWKAAFGSYLIYAIVTTDIYLILKDLVSELKGSNNELENEQGNNMNQPNMAQTVSTDIQGTGIHEEDTI